MVLTRKQAQQRHNESGPYSVYLHFLDSSKLKVRDRVSDLVAKEAFDYYCRGIGALVGTTREVVIVDDEGAIIKEWTHQLRKDIEPAPNPQQVQQIRRKISINDPNVYTTVGGQKYYRDPGSGYVFLVDINDNFLIDPHTGIRYYLDPSGKITQA